MSNPTFRASDVFEMINTPDLFKSNHWTCNAVVEYITDYFADNEYSSIDSLAGDLEMAHWDAGSLDYSEQAEFLNVASNRDDVEEVFSDLLDSMGEPIEIREFSDMLIHALDHVTNAIASLIYHADLAIVVNHADYMDTDPEVIICDKYDADDKVSEIIQHRLDMEVQHSTETVTEEDLDAMEETLLQLVFTVV